MAFLESTGASFLVLLISLVVPKSKSPKINKTETNTNNLDLIIMTNENVCSLTFVDHFFCSLAIFGVRMLFSYFVTTLRIVCGLVTLLAMVF